VFKQEILIGSSEANDVVIADPSVDSFHAKFIIEDSSILLENLSTEKKTLAGKNSNLSSIEFRKSLSLDDEVKFGNTLFIVKQLLIDLNIDLENFSEPEIFKNQNLSSEEFLTRKSYIYASLWHRFLAGFVDQSIGFCAGFIIGLIFIEQLILTNIIAIIFTWLYYSLQHCSDYQATVGMRVLKLKIIDTNSEKITFLRATCRYFTSIISALILGIGFFMIAWTKKKQGLHDLICDTLVVKKIG